MRSVYRNLRFKLQKSHLSINFCKSLFVQKNFFFRSHVYYDRKETILLAFSYFPRLHLDALKND